MSDSTFDYSMADAHDDEAPPHSDGDAPPQLVTRSPRWRPPDGPADDLPQIMLGVDQARVVGEAIDALAGLGEHFWRGRSLVRIVGADPAAKVIRREADAATIEIVPREWLSVDLARAARWISKRKGKPKPGFAPAGPEPELVAVTPPTWVSSAICAAPSWPGIPQLVGVTESPALRPDGTILDRPGYDEATGLVYRPVDAVATVPDRPTPDQARRAVDELLEIVADFPFEAPEHRSAWIAAILTPFARPAIDGPCPMFLIEATTAGSGKSLLASVTGLIATGRTLPTSTWPEKEEERKKWMTTVAMDGAGMLQVDNVVGVLGGPTINSALTTTVYSDRILGSTKSTGPLPFSTIFLATGNNVVLGADTSRRVIPIRLAPQVERPEERDGFRHAELAAWVRRHRGRLAIAALTILRAWVVAGRPRAQIPAMGSFEAWSMIRHVCVWVGMTDPLRAQAMATEAGGAGDAVELKGIIKGLVKLAGGTSRTAHAILDAVRKGHAPELREVLLEHVGRGGELPDPRKLGYRLRHHKGRVVDGMFLAADDAHAGTAKWYVKRVGGGPVTGGDGGHGGDPPSYNAGEISNFSLASGHRESPPSPPSPPVDMDEDVVR